MSHELRTAAFRSTATGVAKMVLVVLGDRADDDGLCFPGLDWIADRAGWSLRAVRNAIAELEVDRHLTTLKRPGRPAIYSIHPIGALTPARGAEVEEETPARGADVYPQAAEQPRHEVPATPARGAQTPARGADEHLEQESNKEGAAKPPPVDNSPPAVTAELDDIRLARLARSFGRWLHIPNPGGKRSAEERDVVRRWQAMGFDVVEDGGKMVRDMGHKLPKPIKSLAAFDDEVRRRIAAKPSGAAPEFVLEPSPSPKPPAAPAVEDPHHAELVARAIAGGMTAEQAEATALEVEAILNRNRRKVAA